MFLMRQRWRFTGCANRHQTGGAIIDLKIHQFAKAVRINSAIFEWRNKRGARPGKARQWRIE
jgi:hypothetical protein